MQINLKIFTLGAALFLVGCSSSPKIIYKPIQFGSERIKLTQQYRCQHYKLCGKGIKIVPRMIVLHWTAIPTFKASYSAINQVRIGGRPYLQKYLKINPSAQYLVARNGQIYQLMPDDWMAVHVIGLNYMAIQYLVGHYEYQCFRKAPLWKEHNPNYLTGKVDPGPKFMQAVRQQVAGLDLKGCP